jgi:hypothetical protein
MPEPLNPLTRNSTASQLPSVFDLPVEWKIKDRAITGLVSLGNYALKFGGID